MPDRKQISFSEAKKLLERYNIKVSGEICRGNIESLSEAADRLGYPVVLKTSSEKIVHKSDIGAVIVNIENRKQLEEALEKINRNVEKAGYEKQDEFLIQKMAENGFEVLIGAHQDPVFGPLIITGSGGKYVELLKDTAPGIGKLTEKDV